MIRTVAGIAMLLVSPVALLFGYKLYNRYLDFVYDFVTAGME